MKYIAQLLFIGGFCVATIGGAGFSDPLEPNALIMFIGGLVLVLIGGIMLRRAAHAEAHEKVSDGLSEEGLANSIKRIADDVRSLVSDASSLDGKQLCTRIDAILQGPFFDVGSRNEDYMRVLGNTVYTRYWDGFAVSERLLARSWSMAADGALEEAVAELPGVLKNIERATASRPHRSKNSAQVFRS
ncbi:MAG: hypothetical protein GY747_07535 [Planctomycetes bacterium]|nr:hypothetical protein [Planctomycetota bacterium]MCP4771048.1 hypothetical protein [Planctomycetota bacterium]